MENQNNPNPNQEENWLDEILEAPALSPELEADEGAISAAGLSHSTGEPAPREPEESVAESAERWDEEAAARMTEQAPFRDEEYRDAFGDDGESLAAVFDQVAAEEAAPAEPLPPENEPAEDLLEEGLAPLSPEDDCEEAPEAPARKRRPERKKGYGLFGIPHILATFVWLAIIAAIGVSLGRVVWVCAADVLAFGREPKVITFTVEAGDTIDTITGKLKDAGLIRYPQLFKLYADLTDAQEDISTGTFQLNTIYDYHALVNAMSYYAEGREEVEVAIPEGYNCAQIFALLEEKNVCNAKDLEEYAASGELSHYWFLEDVERGSKYCLEGYLFPDTYKFFTHDEPRWVLEKMLDDFEYRVSEFRPRVDEIPSTGEEGDEIDVTLPEYYNALDALNERLSEMMAANGYDQDYIDSHQLTMHQVVIVASLIEKETADSDESPMIASVIYNRLTNQGEYPFLNIDAAILYAQGGGEKVDTSLDSPYNTYTHQGLTPGPISNPGRSSILAALEPADSDYHYYAYDPEAGEHHFSRTLAEHEAFLETVSYE